MKAPALSAILDGWNTEWFKSTEEKLRVKLSIPEGASPMDAVRLTTIDHDERCYCGTFNDDKLFPGEIRHSVSRRSVAVGAVLDDQSSPDADLPVIIGAGINYWQFGNRTADWSSAGWRDTKMRPRLNAAIARLVERGCWSQPPPKDYHLVAVNFFPWVTRTPWSEVPNSLTEAMALHCWGIADAPERIAKLIEAIRPAPVVAFHGVNNAVPVLGLRTIASVTRKPLVVFTDNLGYSTPPKNVATLLNRVARHTTHVVEDE